MFIGTSNFHMRMYKQVQMGSNLCSVEYCEFGRYTEKVYATNSLDCWKGLVVKTIIVKSWVLRASCDIQFEISSTFNHRDETIHMLLITFFGFNGENLKKNCLT